MPLDLGTLIIETERLRLSPVCPEDVDAIFEQFTPEVTRYMYPAAPRHRGDTALFVHESEQAMREGLAYRASVRLRDGGHLIGMVGVEDLAAERPAYGVWIGVAHHGNGYGREAVLGVHGWARGALRQRVVLYPVDRENLASRKIAEALGGVIERERAEASMGGKTLHLLEYHVPLDG